MKINRSKEHLIGSEHVNQRVDNYLISQFKHVPKSRIYKAIRKGEVRVNKKRVKAQDRLQAEDVVRLPPLWQPEIRQIVPSERLQALLLSSIIFEDDDLLIVNKPAGLAVHSGTGNEIGLIETLRYARSDLSYIELVHRLDKQTSGCLLLAKSLRMRRVLQDLFKLHHIEKMYLALVKGKWRGDSREIKLPLLKVRANEAESYVKVDDQYGKASLSIFEPLLISKDFSLIKVALKTGRMHQIRVHAAQIGYPIIGDNKYGDRQFNADMRKQLGTRLFLHSAQLAFTLPYTNQYVNLCACLDAAFYKAIRTLL